jgi:hypothetical protein
VYITTSSGVCQAQTRIQEQFVLGSNHKCGVLGFKHNVYSDSSTMLKGFWDAWTNLLFLVAFLDLDCREKIGVTQEVSH